MGLGNPGPAYDATRHNVGWWMADRLAYDWKFGAFRRDGPAFRTEGALDGEEVVILKPSTYMNRSGAALRPWMGREGFDVSGDLLVIVDDATRDVGRVRFRSGGSSGGHKGLRSIGAAAGTDRFARLRIGVGIPPSGADLVDWVLSPMDGGDETVVVELLPELSEAVRLWVAEGIEPTMNRFNK